MNGGGGRGCDNFEQERRIPTMQPTSLRGGKLSATHHFPCPLRGTDSNLISPAAALSCGKLGVSTAPSFLLVLTG